MAKDLSLFFDFSCKKTEKFYLSLNKTPLFLNLSKFKHKN